MTDRKRPPATADGDGDAPPKQARRRGQALLDAIHQAVILEAAEVGVARLTMEGVARRAGTAKTSLYRRWSSPEDILLEAMYEVYPQEEFSPDADDLRGDLVRALMLLRAMMDREPLGRAMFAVVAEAMYRPDFYRRLTRDVFDARGGRFTATVLQHYADRGRIDPARVTPVTVDIGEALLVKYATDHQEVPGPEYVEQIVDQVILPAIGQAPR